MKGSEQRDVITLGKLQVIHDLMDIPVPEEFSQKIFEARRIVLQVLDAHWDNCNKLISEDDT